MARPRSDIAPRIVHAARARFLGQGVDGASLRQIAEDAGTSIGMVYYYFPTKDDLFLAVVEEVYVALLADLEGALSPVRSVEARLDALYQRLGALTADETLVMRIVLREVLASPVRLRRLIQRFRRGHLPLVMKLLEDGRARGVFDRRHPPALVLVSMMALGGLGQAVLGLGARLPLPPPPPGTKWSALLVEVLLRGVGAPPPRRQKPARKR
jgi:AcrR family transcriptional regulator